MAESDLTITITGKDVNVVQLLNKITGGMEDLEKTSKKVTTAVAKNVNDLSGSVTRLTQKVTGPFTGAIGQLAGLVGVGGFIATLKKAVVMADDWEEQMASLSVTLGDKFGGSIKEVETRIREMTKTTSISTAELMAGFQQIAKSSVKGVDTVDGAMKVLDATQKLAVATNSELGTTVRGVTNLMGAFGMSVDQTAHVSNTLLLASQRSNMSFGELSGTMGFLANTAKQVGIGMDDMLGALVGMQRAGVPVSQSVQAMNAMIMGMLNPSKELTALVKGLPGGFVSVADMVKRVGLVGYFEALKKATGGNIEVMERYIPNMRAMRGAAALVGKGLDEMRGFLDESKSSTDKLESAFQKMVGTKEFELFMKKITEGLREVGERMMPKVMENLNSLGAWFDANREQIIKSIVTAGEALMGFLKFVVTNADTILKVFLTIWGVEKVAGFAKSIVDLASAFGALKGAIAALGVGKVGSLLAAITGGASVAAVAGAAAVIGGTAYAAFNLAAPENKLKPSEMDAMEAGIPPVVPNNQAWAADFAGKFGDLVKQEEKIAIDAYKSLSGEADKIRRKLTKEEIEDRKKAIEYLSKFEIDSADERTKLQLNHEKKIEELEKMRGLTKAEKQSALEKLEEQHAEEMNLLEFKQMSDSLELQMANSEKIAKDRSDLLVEAEKVAADAGEEYHKRRMAWAAEMEKRESEALKRQEEQDKGDWTKFAFWKEVGKGFAKKVGETLYGWAVSIADLITTPLSAIGDMVGSLFGGFKTIGAAPFGKITEIFNSILGGSGIGDVKAATEQAAIFFEQLAKKLPAALDWFANKGVPRIINAFVNNVGSIIQSLVRNIPIIIDSVIKNLDKIILPFVKGMLTLIPQLIKRIPDLIKEIAKLLPQVLAEALKSLPSIIGASVKGVFESIGSLFSGFVSGLSDIFTATSEEEKATAQNKLAAYNTAKKMGYTNEQAEAASEAFANQKAGKSYDYSTLAKFMGDLAYKDAIEAGKTEEEANAARTASYNEVIGQAPHRRTPGEVPKEELDLIVARAKGEAQKAYDQMYKHAMDSAETSWLTEKDRLKRRGLSDAEISEERKAFMTQAEQNARDRAEEEYQRIYDKVYETLLQSPGGAGTPLIDTNRGETTPTPVNPSEPTTVHKWHQGGVITGAANLARAIRAHSGYSVPGGLAAGDVPIIAQAGESIMTREWTKNAGGQAGVEAQNAAGRPGGGVVNNVFVEHMMSGDTAQVIDKLITDNLRSGAGKLYERFNTGRAVGYKTRRS